MKLKERSILTVMRQQPEKLGGNFYCSNNKLTSLVGGPHQVGGDFWCSCNELTDLVGGPHQVGAFFIVIIINL